MWAGSERRWLCSLVACLLCLGVSCTKADAPSDGIFFGKVVAPTPVQGAHVSVWQLYVDGEKYALLAEATTDEAGTFTVHVGQAIGNILFEVTGGVTAEPWAPDEEIVLEMELRAVLTDYLPGPLGTVQIVSITPLTTIATALGESRLAHPEKEDNYKDAMRRANELLGQHFGDISLTSTPVARTTIEAHNMRDGVRHGLVLAGLSGLAQWIAEEAFVSAQAVNTLVLTEKLVEDASDEGAIFDGEGREGPLRVITCPQPPECQADPASCEPSVCDLDANTLRADLATGLAFYFMPAEHNGTLLSFDQVRPLIDSIWTHEQPELFGLAPIGDLGGELPAAIVALSYLDDEWTDEIIFSPAAVPRYRRTGPITVLDGEGACEEQIVRKYVTRMNDPKDNPLRWVFSVVDERGIAITRDGGEYRVGLRGQDNVAWLTGWRKANPLDTPRTDGVDYEVVLLRSELPELATERGIFEIEFRGMDALERMTPVARACWEHVPLAAPLWVGPAMDVPASDPRSLYGVRLGEGLAPLLNGVPLAEGKGIMEFEIRNGTTEPVYVTLDVEQPAASYTKSWQKTNAWLREDPLPSNCLRNGTCVAEFPPELSSTVMINQTGTADRLITSLLIWDASTGEPLAPCLGCDSEQYRLEPRRDESNPRVYRLMAMVTDLAPLAPEPIGEDWGPFEDAVLDPIALPTAFSGRRFAQVTRCREADWATAMCEIHDIYRHYLALTAIAVTIDRVRVHGRTSPTATLDPLLPAEQSDTLGIPVEHAPTPWTNIASLPSPLP